MKGFHVMDDGSAVHLLDHVRELIAAQPDVEVLVGSDSQNRSGSTIYTTAVVLRYRRNGAHVLYCREDRERVRDLWTRLWGEVERSLDVAQALVEGGVPVRSIDMDLNSDPRFGSNKLHNAAVGHVRALGYVAHTKPEMLIATWAANVLCQRWGRKHEAPTGL
ncbi:MAG: hypothetical protein JST41_03270 [Bacteroidetes bacterium]|jgi:predicted RNase H-related nuclease YkuK (DUF458 family)|nr:hypothetical protein [Bacteroidota bacterium]MBX7129449.1 hypothetical protein [Flavobacteriales bacterium]MCC6653626.1 hypothetical protein [Flavobacteriales bacterium]HMU13071.1 ribonuclease H-like YkuK family protein [Flavobacteriales bacterium]HMW96932.1 ribonuclease H-like YkuK family protein [Flavobacteriales bacterium]